MMVMRAGRTDPAGCADVAGDAVLARAGESELGVLAALHGSDLPTPAGATVLDVGGLRLWSYDAEADTADRTDRADRTG